MREFREKIVLANWEVFSSKVSNAKGCRIPVRSSWNLEKFETLLEGYEDKEVITYLKYRWPAGCINSGTQTLPQNHKGADSNHEVVKKQLQKQAEKGSLIGPFDQNVFGD